MDKKNRHIEQLTPELIQAYHAGTLTSSEMHQVELLMVENTLYNEGIEGLESLSSEELNLDIDTLSAKIDEITEDDKIGFWTTWKKAAAVILVLITASGLFYFNQPADLPTKELSEVKKPLKNEDTDSLSNKGKANSAPQTEAELSSDQEVDTQAIKPNQAIPEKQKVADLDDKATPVTTLARKAEAIEALPAPKALALSKPSLEKKNSLRKEAIQLSNEVELKGVQTSIADQSAKRKLSNAGLRSSLVAESTPKDLSTNSVQGIVVGSDDGLPLPQVTVLEKGTTNGIQTNQGGEFNFESLKPNSTLVFRYLGYVTQEVKISSQDTMRILLSPDATSLGEVIVTGVAAATPEKKLPFTTTTIEGGTLDGTRARTNVGNTQSSTRAKPVDGFSKFNRYLKKNLVYPEAAKPLKIRGQVKVEFRVSSTGELFDFRVIKGLGHGCDEEAIRLIKEGPKWNPKTIGSEKRPVLSIVTVKVRFRP